MEHSSRFKVPIERGAKAMSLLATGCDVFATLAASCEEVIRPCAVLTVVVCTDSVVTVHRGVSNFHTSYSQRQMSVRWLDACTSLS